jgi:hypothetical protein
MGQVYFADLSSVTPVDLRAFSLSSRDWSLGRDGEGVMMVAPKKKTIKNTLSKQARRMTKPRRKENDISSMGVLIGG